ncbi:D-arginine dehydrogenase [Limimonas halophila]|uniref:D-arginine dehydrogenase n=1 Tax=Limimonas halophila TaxID=1082479 RepID=A0A1G7S984_9PROT|nr:FAD-binding oxidoreductase [Limimonas halophila]SDG19553.1 D-arginine dehydrogenase [Limimonas halophila]
MADREADILIVGGGIAGASLAATLAADRGDGGGIVVLEGERQPGYHATGRSAAMYIVDYGPPVIRALTQASGAFFRDPPAGFSDKPLLTPRGLLSFAVPGEDAAFEQELAQSLTLSEISVDEALARCPVLKREVVGRAAAADAAEEIDVAALHQGYLAQFKKLGGEAVTGAEIETIERAGGTWRVRTDAATWTAATLVNAAGAWVDAIARMAGVRQLGFTPKQRSAILADTTPEMDSAGWPMVLDISGTFYFKPESGHLLVSPADATPTDPGDVRPDELDVAVAADRLERHTALSVRRIAQSWAGQRTFAPDHTPVIGADPREPGFFWLAGQGGYGIQTAPAVSRISADLLAGREVSMPDIPLADLRPDRFDAGA